MTPFEPQECPDCKSYETDPLYWHPEENCCCQCADGRLTARCEVLAGNQEKKLYWISFRGAFLALTLYTMIIFITAASLGLLK